MSEYTPTTEQVREVCVLGHYPLPTVTQRIQLGAGFDRRLAGVRAEAKAEALNDAAEWERLTKIGESPRNQSTEEQIQEF